VWSGEWSGIPFLGIGMDFIGISWGFSLWENGDFTLKQWEFMGF
jgi:hypothetical protein